VTPSQRNMMNRHLRRYANAVENKAFQGTIPYGESIAAAKAYDEIDIELERARSALIRFMERLCS
jgi:hypothetical protein